jgi:SpoIID/LytB domain protein
VTLTQRPGRSIRALVAMTTVSLLAVPVTIGSVASPVAAGPATVELDGRGNGHGIGLSQWGAYGYASEHGWTAQQILDHYYGGTVSAAADITSITVRLMALDDVQTAVIHDRNALTVDGVTGGPWRSVVVRETAQRSYSVWARSDVSNCPMATDPLSDWTLVASALGSVTIRPSTDTSASPDFADLIGVCEPGGRVRSYRGVIRAANGTDNENRTINEVPVEQYLRSVVASEMSASWAAKGAAALQAQAVAARSYGLAEKRYSYAKTCDKVCQFYPGAAWRPSPTASYTRVEQTAVDAAVAATAGTVRRVGSAAGAIAYTMFSASSGGWTASSSLGFPAVFDDGDDTAGNPFHTWRVSVPAATITAAWPAIGDFVGINVTARTGQGEWGGRVVTMTVTGTAGSVSITGDAFRRAAGLRSNWFATSSGAVTPTAPGAPAAPSAVCAGRTELAHSGASAAAGPARFEPATPTRLVDTRDGTGTTAGALAGGCTLVIRPNVPSGSTAVAINIATVNTLSQGYIAAYPCGIARPITSAVQSQVGRIVSGSAIVPLGADGTFCVFTNATTDVVVDLNGSFSPSAGGRFEPIVTQRRFDSRPAGQLLAAGSTVRVSTRFSGGAPATSTAASVTIHALDAAVDGFVTAWPCDRQRPLASSANVMRAGSAANVIDVAVGSTGEVCVFVSAPMHLAVDMNGWYGPTASTDFHAVTPFRLADTRAGLGWSGGFARNSDRPIQLGGIGALPGGAAVRAVSAQLTVVDPAQSGYVTVHPCLASVPQVSMLRYPARTNVAVAVNSIVSGADTWCLTSSAVTHLIVDVTGWFG